MEASMSSAALLLDSEPQTVQFRSGADEGRGMLGVAGSRVDTSSSESRPRTNRKYGDSSDQIRGNLAQ